MQIQLLSFQTPVSKTTLPLLLLMSILTSTLLRKHFIKLSMSPQLKQNYLSLDVRLVNLFKSLTSYTLLSSLILFTQLKGYLTPIFISINYSQLLSLETSDHTSTNTPTTLSNSGIVQVIKSDHFIHQLIKIQKNSTSLPYILTKSHGISARRKNTTTL